MVVKKAFYLSRLTPHNKFFKDRRNWCFWAEFLLRSTKSFRQGWPPCILNVQGTSLTRNSFFFKKKDSRVRTCSMKKTCSLENFLNCCINDVLRPSFHFGEKDFDKVVKYSFHVSRGTISENHFFQTKTINLVTFSVFSRWWKLIVRFDN